MTLGGGGGGWDPKGRGPSGGFRVLGVRRGGGVARSSVTNFRLGTLGGSEQSTSGLPIADMIPGSAGGGSVRQLPDRTGEPGRSTLLPVRPCSHRASETKQANASVARVHTGAEATEVPTLSATRLSCNQPLPSTDDIARVVLGWCGGYGIGTLVRTSGGDEQRSGRHSSVIEARSRAASRSPASSPGCPLSQLQGSLPLSQSPSRREHGRTLPAPPVR